MELEDLMALAEHARRSPHARRVLFDALLERYGAHFETLLEVAQADADRTGQPIVVLLNSARLVEIDDEQPAEWGALALFPALYHRFLSDRHRTPREFRVRDERGHPQQLVVMRPRTERAGR